MPRRETAPTGAPCWIDRSDDADATPAQIESLGGATVVPAEDTPYGRLATAADPTGTVFRIVAPNREAPAT